jgi:hypothetical protein
MARWKPPVLVAIAIATVAAELAVGRAMADRQNTTGYTVVVFAIVFVAFVVVVHVTSIGVVHQPTKRTALVVVGAVMVSLSVAGGIVGQTAFARAVVYPVCERLETDTTRLDGVSRTSSSTQPGVRFFNRYLQCNYRTDDAAVPEGIPTSVDLRDGRLAGGSAGWMRLGYGLSTLAGFLLWLVVSLPFWKWWFRTLIAASKRDPLVLDATNQRRAAASAPPEPPGPLAPPAPPAPTDT